MCDKCIELDGKIAHYRWLASMITDQLTLDRIKELIAKLEWQKAAFHSEQEQGRLGWRPLSFGLAPP
jgi:hypothetical protein